MKRMNWFSKLSNGLRKTTDSIGAVFTKRRLDAATLEELEELLIMADMGAGAAASIVAELAAGRVDKDISEGEIKQLLAASIAKRLAPYCSPLVISPQAVIPGSSRDPAVPQTPASSVSDGRTPAQGRGDRPEGVASSPITTPHVILVVGVNGNGKTTTIGKLAHQLMREGKKVMVVAADTVRAAAVEQLQTWAERAGCSFVRGAENADPASVAYAGVEKAIAECADVVFIDTAGRLHNKGALMEELRKIIRVLRKKDATAPHSVLLVLDATTGQNAIQQVKVFKEMVDVTGLVVTKLDGSARGGIVVALAETFGLPVHAVGVGEKAGDLRPFDAREFARGLVGA